MAVASNNWFDRVVFSIIHMTLHVQTLMLTDAQTKSRLPVSEARKPKAPSVEYFSML